MDATHWDGIISLDHQADKQTPAKQVISSLILFMHLT
jgi:hypothetical protein